MAETAESFRALDSDWLRAHPVKPPESGVDKNSRGRVLIIGGSATVPGGLQLTAEAALRAGAGKVQIATIASACLPLGIAIPEAAVFPLPEDAGEIAVDADLIEGLLRKCDVVVVGPAMSDARAGGRLVDCLLSSDHRKAMVLDAAALLALGKRSHQIQQSGLPIVLTPHAGEMAAMLERDISDVENSSESMICGAAARFNSVVLFKGGTTLIASPEGEKLAFAGGGPGLATGGSGDVLAGIIAGLLARGAGPLIAAATGVWLHGEAGRRCGEELAPLGYLAREVLPRISRVLSGIDAMR